MICHLCGKKSGRVYMYGDEDEWDDEYNTPYFQLCTKCWPRIRRMLKYGPWKKRRRTKR
jgi:hypothetical protein